MSFMNDDADPFGVPYSTSNTGNYNKEKNYSLKDLKELGEKERELTEKINTIKKDKEKAKEQLKKEIDKFVEPYAKIKCDKWNNWKITVKEFELNQLEKMKEAFNLKDIEVKTTKIEIHEDVWEWRIVISFDV